MNVIFLLLMLISFIASIGIFITYFSTRVTLSVINSRNESIGFDVAFAGHAMVESFAQSIQTIKDTYKSQSNIIKNREDFVMFCRECGNKTNDGAAFCQMCGTSLSNNNPVADTKIDTDASLPESGISPAYANHFNSPKKKIPNKTIIVVCVVGIIGIAATSLFILGGQRGGRTDYVMCGAKNCSNLTVGSYSRCATHLFTCKVCKKEIGSLNYGYCNEHYPR